MGTKTVHLFFSSSSPLRLDGSVVIPRGEEDLRPGYVSAIMTGRAVCRAKYTGVSAACRVENWGRERAR